MAQLYTRAHTIIVNNIRSRIYTSFLKFKARFCCIYAYTKPHILLVQENFVCVWCVRVHALILFYVYVCARRWRKNVPKIIVYVYGTHRVLHLAATYANCSLATEISILVCCWCLIFFYIYFFVRCWMVGGGDFSIAKRHIQFFFPRRLCTRAHSLVPFAMQNSILYFYRLRFFFGV